MPFLWIDQKQRPVLVCHICDTIKCYKAWGSLSCLSVSCLWETETVMIPVGSKANRSELHRYHSGCQGSYSRTSPWLLDSLANSRNTANTSSF